MLQKSANFIIFTSDKKPTSDPFLISLSLAKWLVLANSKREIINDNTYYFFDCLEFIAVQKIVPTESKSHFYLKDKITHLKFGIRKPLYTFFIAKLADDAIDKTNMVSFAKQLGIRVLQLLS